MLTPRAALTLNAIGLYAIGFLLLAAFVLQFALDELPCPLCLLQRVAFTALAIGPVLNLRFGPRPGHYALSLLAAVAGAGIAMRQVLLHIMPGDPGYGSAVLGIHYYTWAFVAFVAAIVLIALAMVFDSQFEKTEPREAAPALGWFEKGAVWLMIAMIAANVLNVFVECGLSVCPDNPVTYWMLG